MICTLCKKEKSKIEFHKDKSHANGYKSRCKKCRNEINKGNRKARNNNLKEWRKKNPDNVRKHARDYTKKRRQTDFKFKDVKHWEILVDFTLNELIEHLESKFENNMSWENYGKWHIDHIVPKSYFIYENYKDKKFKECWNLKNLQPLWAEENRLKSNSLI